MGAYVLSKRKIKKDKSMSFFDFTAISFVIAVCIHAYCSSKEIRRLNSEIVKIQSTMSQMKAYEDLPKYEKTRYGRDKSCC